MWIPNAEKSNKAGINPSGGGDVMYQQGKKKEWYRLSN